jgi:hypothetical protein
MNEWVYVLSVESVIFLLVATVITAQQFDVFAYPNNKTWPVLGTTILSFLAYCFFLLVIAIFCVISNYGEILKEFQNACVQTILRLLLIIVVWVTCTFFDIWQHEKHDWPLFLCQLYGVNCNDAGHVLWEMTYSIYLSVLLPIFIICATLQMSVAGSLKKLPIDADNKSLSAPRRCIALQCIFVLIVMYCSTIDENFALACGNNSCALKNNFSVFSQKPGAVLVRSWQSIFIAAAFFVFDLITDIMATLTEWHENIAYPIVFVFFRILQISSMPLLVIFLDIRVPAAIYWTLFVLACIFASVDILQVLSKQLSKDQTEEEASQATSVQTPDEQIQKNINFDDYPSRSQMAFDPFFDSSATQSKRKTHNFLLRAVPRYTVNAYVNTEMSKNTKKKN